MPVSWSAWSVTLFVGTSLFSRWGLWQQRFSLPQLVWGSPDTPDLSRGGMSESAFQWPVFAFFSVPTPPPSHVAIKEKKNEAFLQSGFKTWIVICIDSSSLWGMRNISQNFLKEQRAVIAWLKPHYAQQKRFPFNPISEAAPVGCLWHPSPGPWVVL